ncbi:insulinase family protein [Salegentibacter flavus]|nr:insulinase family protein [Salegentibacter flavus]
MNDLGESYIDQINNFDPDNLRKYYEDWYQPKNVAIAIIGNIPDVEGLQDKIMKRFSRFRNKKGAKNVPDCFSEYFSRPNQFEIIERKRDTTIHFANNNLEVKFFYRDSLIRSSKELQAAKRQVLWEMANEVLEDHLQPLTQSYSSNFKLGVRNTFKYERKPAATSISIEAEPKDLEYSITEVFSKINELQTYGLLPDKWEELKLNHLHNLEKANKIKKETPNLWIDDIERNFWQKEPLTPQKHSLLKAWMEQLELQDFNTFMDNYFGKVPRDIAIIKPEHSTWKVSEDDFRSLIHRNSVKPVLIEKTFTPEHLLSEKEVNKLKPKSISFLGENYKGSKEFLLQNGIRVVLLEDKNYKEKVSVWGFDSIGTANITNTNLYSVAKSPDIIKHAGIGNYNKFEVDRLLKSKNAEIQISPYIENKESGIKGQADLQNTELLFQMIYLYFTAPRKDKAAFKHWKRKELEIFLHPPSYSLHPKDFQNSIKNYFGKSKGDFWGGTYHFNGTREATYEGAFNAYQTIFSDFGNYTFIIRGGDEEALLPQIKKYLGNLNSQKVRTDKINHTVEKKEFPTGPQKVKLKPSEYYERDQVFYAINFTEKIESYDWKKHLMLKLLSALIWEMAMKFSSEEGIAAYYVYNGSEFDRNLSYFSAQLFFECFKDEVNVIQMASKELFKKIKEGNIKQGPFDKALNRIIRLYGKNGIKNDREKDLYDFFRHGITSGTSDEKEKFLHNLNKDDLHKFAKSFLREDHMFEFEM